MTQRAFYSKYEHKGMEGNGNFIIKKMELNTMIKKSQEFPKIPMKDLADILLRHIKKQELKTLINHLSKVDVIQAHN